MKIILRYADGTICEHHVKPDKPEPEDFPSTVVSKGKTFYNIGMKERGTAALFQEVSCLNLDAGQPDLILRAMLHMRLNLSTYKGHGNPGFPSRVQGLLAMQEADKAIEEVLGEDVEELIGKLKAEPAFIARYAMKK